MTITKTRMKVTKLEILIVASYSHDHVCDLVACFLRVFDCHKKLFVYFELLSVKHLKVNVSICV